MNILQVGTLSSGDFSTLLLCAGQAELNGKKFELA